MAAFEALRFGLVRRSMPYTLLHHAFGLCSFEEYQTWTCEDGSICAVCGILRSEVRPPTLLRTAGPGRKRRAPSHAPCLKAVGAFRIRLRREGRGARGKQELSVWRKKDPMNHTTVEVAAVASHPDIRTRTFPPRRSGFGYRLIATYNGFVKLGGEPFINSNALYALPPQ